MSFTASDWRWIMGDDCQCIVCKCRGEVDIFAAVAADLKARETAGAVEYGRRRMTANDGRDTLRDAYEEAMDLAIYLRKMIAERDGA
jgi:hypothetical protein